MPDVAAAAERLESALDRLRNKWTATSKIVKVDGSVLFAYTEDLAVVADAYLAEHRPDDAEPIDEAWLRACGFADLTYQDQTVLAFRFEETEADDLPPDIVEVKAKSRGQLRLLARALGIQLKE